MARDEAWEALTEEESRAMDEISGFVHEMRAILDESLSPSFRTKRLADRACWILIAALKLDSDYVQDGPCKALRAELNEED